MSAAIAAPVISVVTASAPKSFFMISLPDWGPQVSLLPLALPGCCGSVTADRNAPFEFTLGGQLERARFRHADAKAPGKRARGFSPQDFAGAQKAPPPLSQLKCQLRRPVT